MPSVWKAPDEGSNRRGSEEFKPLVALQLVVLQSCVTDLPALVTARRVAGAEHAPSTSLVL